MKTVYKYPLDHRASRMRAKPGHGMSFELEMPKDAQVLAVQTQHDVPTLWALVAPGSSFKEIRVFEVHGTGHDILNPDEVRYIGTFQLDGGKLIWHVFEREWWSKDPQAVQQGGG